MAGYPLPFRIGLMLTERCDVSCAHCWFNCTPDRTATMSLYDAQDFIDKAEQTQTVEWVSFTGGEPMLFPSLVEDLVAYASGLGLRTELVTNCNWATSQDKTLKTIKKLIYAGLNVLNISSDDFHQAYIPFERVKCTYNVAKGLGLKMVIMTAQCRGGTSLFDISRQLGGEISISGVCDYTNYDALGIESGFIPTGRGASLSRKEWFLDGTLLTGGCEDVLRDLGVKPSGEVMPCCSALATIPSFSIGNLKKSSLKNLIEMAWRRDVFRVLTENGPTGLRGMLPEVVYINKCHFCYEKLRILQ